MDARLPEGNFDRDTCTLARGGPHINPVVQCLSQSPNDRQTQSKAAALCRPDALIVLIEYMRQLISCNANATVPHFDTDLVARASATQQQFSVIGVSHRIRKQIADHLLEHALVAVNHDSTPYDTQFQAFFLDRPQKIACHRVEYFVDCKIALLGTQASRFE